MRKLMVIGTVSLLLAACAAPGERRERPVDDSVRQASAEGPTQTLALDALQTRMRQECFGNGGSYRVLSSEVTPVGGIASAGRGSGTGTGTGGLFGGALDPLGRGAAVVPGAPAQQFRAESLFRCTDAGTGR